MNLYKWISIVFIIVGLSFVLAGFEKKNNYNLDENYPDLNRNAYVGGDSYNYIINGTYFTGYLTLGACFILSGIIAFVTGDILPVLKENNKILTKNLTQNENVSNIDEDLTKF